MLLCGHLYLCRPLHFHDPFTCMGPFCFHVALSLPHGALSLPWAPTPWSAATTGSGVVCTGSDNPRSVDYQSRPNEIVTWIQRINVAETLWNAKGQMSQCITLGLFHTLIWFAWLTWFKHRDTIGNLTYRFTFVSADFRVPSVFPLVLRHYLKWQGRI